MVSESHGVIEGQKNIATFFYPILQSVQKYFTPYVKAQVQLEMTELLKYECKLISIEELDVFEMVGLAAFL
jgi:hypothetical protein